MPPSDGNNASPDDSAAVRKAASFLSATARDWSQNEKAVDVDLQRHQRCGFPEVIYGSGKPVELIINVIRQQRAAQQSSFVTRLDPDVAAVLQAEFPQAIHNPVARTVRIPLPEAQATSRGGPVFVVTAGSSDRPVAEEATETLRWMNIECELLQDCGVAGPHRLERHLPKLKTAQAIVCVAGMEAALPSVIGGHVACPVIGVPTSVGYGASLDGLTALLSMVTCCASNVVAVNIDAGFKGGYVAGLIASRGSR
ncbi:MAG: nickel pincer cofactor biosynthesis protein LarB [Planctomycetaceae bacterium]|nr:nickel pincer cofactor biosynthesis protein LarB [Planctomycetaceae bacterium]